MSESAIKKRMRRAIAAAVSRLDNPPGSYEITVINNHVFHIEAARPKEIRRIRIALDRISPEDERLVMSKDLPDICTKEIWCRTTDGRFRLKKLKP